MIFVWLKTAARHSVALFQSWGLSTTANLIWEIIGSNPVRDPEFFFVPCLWHADHFIFTYLHVPRKYHHLNLPECFPSQGLLWVENLYIVTRAQINAQSTDSIQPRWPFDWTNFWVVSHNFWPTCKYTVGDQEKIHFQTIVSQEDKHLFSLRVCFLG